jgi:hypothetical protein
LESWFNNQQSECDSDDARGSVPSDFFNSKEDEVLFFNFGLYSNNYHYNDITYPSLVDTVDYFNSFATKFIHYHNRYSQEKGSIEDFLNKCFTQTYQFIAQHRQNSSSVSLSNYVFPILFTQLPLGIRAQEYYVLQISDFDNLSQRGSARDYEQLQQVMGKSTSMLRKKFIDPIEDNLGKKTEFHNSYHIGNKNVAIYCYAPESLPAPIINSNINLGQIKYGENLYQYDTVQIDFQHTKQFIVTELTEKMSVHKASNEPQIVYQRKVEPLPQAIPQKRENSYLYIINGETKSLDSVVKDKEFNTIEIQYTFYLNQYLLEPSRYQLGYIGFTSRNVPQSNIQFQENPATKLWNKLLPFLPYIGILLFIFAMIGIAIRRGKNIQINKEDIDFDGFTDRFKEMKDCVINEIDYCAWDKNTGRVSLRVKINPKYQKWLIIKWKYQLTVRVHISDLNDSGLKATIHHIDGSGEKEINKEFILRDDEYAISLTQSFGSKLDFDSQRYTFKIITDISITKSLWWFKPQKETIRGNIKPYQFEIGRNLGRTWVGFDPGTTGSSIAFGNDSRKIHFSKYYDLQKGLSTINNSVVTFEKELDKNEYNKWKPGIDYLYGINAHNAPDKFRKFRSMKKLLGYQDELPVIIDRKQVFNLKGTQIFMLLVKGLYQELKDYVNHTGEGEGYLQSGDKQALFHSGAFAPQRAVVAVPNSFSSRRTQDMIDSIAALGEFKEIIPVYEAESVLFYCIKRNIIANNSKVLVFDMGGATINTSFFDLCIEKDTEGTHYTINTLGRIGYGIGGDTIDFCIINAILSIKSLQKTLGIDGDEKMVKKYRNENASKLLALAFKIKEDIVNNFHAEKKDYITANNLTNWARSREYLDETDIHITEEDEDFKRIFSGSNPEFFEKYIKDTVYDNIRDSIKELLAFKEVVDCKKQPVKLIFSGRSTTFPFVEKYVKDELTDNGFTIDILNLQEGSYLLENLKTVVAEGSCWYGLQRSNVTLKNNKCFHSFVVKKSIDGRDIGVDFIPFIERGEAFSKDINGKMKISKEKEINSRFGNDNNNAYIYQVTGDSPKDYYNKEGLKHKISLVASLDAVTKIEEIELILTPDDILECVAKYDKDSKNHRRSNGNMQAVDIVNENDEHYIFAAKQEQL